MGSDAIVSNEALVAALIAQQAPQWAGLAVRALASTGTDNALYGLGDRLVVRLPKRAAGVPLIDREAACLPRLGGLPLATPRLRLAGSPGPDFGYPFLVLDWIAGDIARLDRLDDPEAAGTALARFLVALAALPTGGAPRAGPGNHNRGVALSQLDTRVRGAVAVLGDEIDARAALARWDRALAAPAHDRAPVWLHGDLKADNLLARDGRLVAVIDWGLAAIGDPAADYAACWSWLPEGARRGFRGEIGADDAAWARAEGWALYGAVIALAFWRGGDNPRLVATSRATLAALGLA